MKHFFLIILLLTSFSLHAQDTLTVMTYNILNYPTQISTRYDDLKVIIQYTKPDIFICSEMNDISGVSLLLTNAFNVAPVTYYASATYMDGPDTDNMLYYNTNKVSLASQDQITTALRDISHYSLYTCETTDTIWYDVFSLHLKASSGSANANDRLAECVILSNYIGTLPTNTNIIVGGDFNFYGVTIAGEPGWNQLTVNCPQPLKDPINMPGEWQANSFYADFHTQSTRSSTNPGCCGGSTGGMDDRFDFLLINQNLKDGLEGAQYIPGTYTAIGQDGNHFNKSIIESPVNSSVPASVNTALFNMSDHLPVLMKVRTCDITIGLEDNIIANHLSLSFPNENQIWIDINYLKEEKVVAEILTINGSLVTTSSFISIAGNNQFQMQVPILEKGMYILRLNSVSGPIVKKFVR